MVDERLGHVREAVNLLGCLVAAPGDESLHVVDCRGDVAQGGVEVGSAAVDHLGQRGETVLELDDLGVRISKGPYHLVEVGDHVDDVAAALGEYSRRPGQFGQSVAQLVAVAAHRVGRAVDESAYRAAGQVVLGPQVGHQTHELLFDLIPFQWDSRSFDGNHCAVPQYGAAVDIGRRELDVPGGDQVLGHDHRVRLGGDGHSTIDRQCHRHLLGLTPNPVDGADFHACDAHLITGIDTGRAGEVRGDRGGAEEGVVYQ